MHGPDREVTPMGNMDGWQIGLLVVAGYIAVTALVRMMRHRRDRLIEEFRDEFAAEQKRKRQAELTEAQQRRDPAA